MRDDADRLAPIAHWLCAAADIAPGSVAAISLATANGPCDIAVYNLDGTYFATADLCTHGEARLSDGEIEDGLIICPFHLGSFDIRSGAAVAAPCSIPVATYRIAREGADLFLLTE
jgi:nitrite reductase/ring-hydroxylating ferredoxin subunit